MRIARILTLFACITILALTAQAGIIGNWIGSSRSWNSSDMLPMKNAMIAAGHTVLPDGAIDAGALAGMTAFLIGEAGAAPTAGELAVLSTWINAGGTLLVFFDSDCSGCSGGNPTLAGVGSAMTASGSASVAPYPAGNFATVGLVGQTLATTPGTGISGGTPIAGSYIHYQAIGSGHVFAFGDRSDHNVFGTSNNQLFDNILKGGSAPQQQLPGNGDLPGNGEEIPEPTTAALLLLGLAGLGAYRLKK